MNNLADIHAKISVAMNGKIDSASYAYVEEQIKEIKAAGGDPADYSLVMLQRNAPLKLQDGEYRVTMEIKVVKTDLIEPTPQAIIDELRALDEDIERGNDTTAEIRANIDRRIAAQIKKLEKIKEAKS